MGRRRVAVACAAPLNHIVTSGVRATSGDYCDRSENTSRRRRRRRPLTRDCCYATGISGACARPVAAAAAAAAAVLAGVRSIRPLFSCSSDGFP